MFPDLQMAVDCKGCFGKIEQKQVLKVAKFDGDISRRGSRSSARQLGEGSEVERRQPCRR